MRTLWTSGFKDARSEPVQIIVGDEREYEQEDEQNEGVNRTKDENERDRTG